MRATTSRLALCTLAASALWFTPGCGTGTSSKPADPFARVRDENLDVRSRVDAVNDLWATSGEGHARREAVKRIAWQAGLTAPARIRALELLETDPNDENAADTRSMMRLMLAVEPDTGVGGYIAGRAGANRWQEFAPALVRSWARLRAGTPDTERPERAALLAIAPNQPVESTVFVVFESPLPANLSGPEQDRADKARRAAWEVLSRLDASGSRRAVLLAASSSGVTDDPLVADLRASATDLKAVPLTASQLEWVSSLRRDAAWWAEARAVVASLPADRLDGWALRHVEPVRWASTNRPAWLALDRAALLAQLRASFQGRSIFTRGERAGGETLADWADRLTWGDLLTLAAIDEAVRWPGLGIALAEHIDRDRRDTSTEYGGILQWQSRRPGSAAAGTTDTGSGTFVPVIYPPRPTQRQGDRRFVASSDMLTAGASALAHFHFHAQRDDNADYAGPSGGDMDYAQDQGRACVVFTTVRAGVVNADYYQPGGITVDLGEVRTK